MKISEIRSKSTQELVSLERELKLELTKLHIKKNMGVREAGNGISALRKSIARIKTVIAERERVR